MIIRHNLPNRGFTRIDRKVFSNSDISDGAARLYGYLCGLRNGANFSDKYIMKVLNISQAVVTKRKKELKDYGLILIDRISPRVYVIYIGYMGMPAKSVKEMWSEEDDTPPSS